MKALDRVLREAGFSERESKTYLALLELGQTTVGPIAARTRLQHSKVYQTLEKLIDKGLVSFVVKSKTKHFQALDPKHILDALKEKERMLTEALPLLRQKQVFAEERQVATVCEGRNAITTLFNTLIDSLEKDGYYYVFAFEEEYVTSAAASQFLRNVHLRLAEKGVDDRLIASIAIRRAFRKNYSDIENIRFRFTRHHMPRGLIVTNGRVINWVWGDRPTAVEIVSGQIAAMYRNFFLDIWSIAKP